MNVHEETSSLIKQSTFSGHSVKTVPKPDRKIVETDTNPILLTNLLYMTAHFPGFVQALKLKSGGAKLNCIFVPNPTVLCKTIQYV